MDHTVVVLIAKDEPESLLREFCAFHLVCGVERIHIYDNDSRVPISQTLHRYVSDGRVVVRQASGRGIQMRVYAEATSSLRGRARFVALIDTDEFLVLRRGTDLRQTIESYDWNGVGAHQVGWRIFGSGGHVVRPAGLTICNYTMATPLDWGVENLHTKAIVMPDRCSGVAASNPHYMRLLPGFRSVSEDGMTMQGAFAARHCSESIQLNHYVTRSREDFEEKIRKGRIDSETLPGKTMVDFSRFDDAATERDEAAVRFGEVVGREMAGG